MNAMNASAVGPAPKPPMVEINTKGGRAAVVCAFNGVQHRAVIDMGERNWVRPADMAAMLEALAAKVRVG